MRRILGTALTVMAAATMAGCGSSSKPKKRAPVGRSFGETFAASKDSAARSVLLRHAASRKEAISTEAAGLEALLPPPPPPPPGSGAVTAPPLPPAGTPPNMNQGLPLTVPRPLPPVPPAVQPGTPTTPSGQPGPPLPKGPGTPGGTQSKPPEPGPTAPVPGQGPKTGTLFGTEYGVPLGANPTAPRVTSGMAPPGGATAAPSGPGTNLPPGMTPAKVLEALGKARTELSLWDNLITELNRGRAARCFVVREWKVSDEGAERASSRLVVTLIGAYVGLSNGDLSFELQWRRQIRPPAAPGDAPKADWELGDCRPITESGENKPE